MGRPKGEGSRGGKKSRHASASSRRRSEVKPEETERLLHDLRTHQIELQMQNEELRSARSELEASLARYTELYELAPIGFVIVDPTGMIHSVNHSAAKLLARSRESLLNTWLTSLVAEAHKSAFREFLARIMLSGDAGPLEWETVLEVPHGTAHVRLTGVLRSAERTLLLSLQDITARKRVEDELVESDRRKDEFLAMLAHELRNPLTPIRMSVSLARRAPDSSATMDKALGVMERQVAHLARIVDDLLDVARIKRGKIALHRSPIDLCEVTRRTADDHRAALEEAGVALQLQIYPEPVWVDADATRIVQVISNLLGNASKFTPRSGRVEVKLTRTREAAELRISDSGYGMTEEMLKRAFEAFAQAPQSADRPSGGLGLGLAMVKGLIELHDGSVALASDGPGRGTSITVRLPLCAAPDQAAAASEPAAVVHHRVLVIENNADSAEMLRRALEMSGQTAQVVHDGASALAVADEFLPDIILCDIGLPGMSGYEVARALRADGLLKNARLIALSGYAQPLDVERARQAGFDRHVAKPITIEELQMLLSIPPPPAAQAEVRPEKGPQWHTAGRRNGG